MDFDWHDDKETLVRNTRGFGFDVAIRIFAGRTLEWQDTRRDYGEVRMIAVGEFQGDFYTVVYTDRDGIRWIVTAWPSNRKERSRWHASA